MTRPHCPQYRGEDSAVWQRDAFLDSQVYFKKEPWRKQWGQSPRGSPGLRAGAQLQELHSRSFPPPRRPLTPALCQESGPREIAEDMVKWARASPVTVTRFTWFQTQVPRQAPPELPRNRTTHTLPRQACVWHPTVRCLGWTTGDGTRVFPCGSAQWPTALTAGDARSVPRLLLANADSPRPAAGLLEGRNDSYKQVSTKQRVRSKGAHSAPSHPTLAIKVLPFRQRVPSPGRQAVGWEAPWVPTEALGPSPAGSLLEAAPVGRPHTYASPGPPPDNDPLGSEPFGSDLQAHVTLTVPSAPMPSMETYPLETGSDPHRAGWQGQVECLSGVTRQGRGAPAADPASPGHWPLPGLLHGSRGASQTRETADPHRGCRSSGC